MSTPDKLSQPPAAEWVAIDTLAPWDKNPRRNDEAAKEVAKSIQRFGFGAPVLARSADRVVIAGHTRLKAAALLGLDKVPCRFLDLDPAEARALALADNKLGELADWDEALLGDVLRDLEADGASLDGLGFTDDELKALLADPVVEPSENDDDVPEVDEHGESDSVLGGVYELGPHRLVCGDSTTAEVVDLLLPDGMRVDAVVTSPPYAVGVDYGEYNDTIESLRALLSIMPTAWLRAVRPGGFAVVNFGDLVSGRDMAGTDEPCEYPMALEYWPAFRSAGWVLWTRRAWCKPNPRCAAPWTASSNRAAADWEHVWTWKSPGDALVSRQNESNKGWIDTSAMHGVDVGKDTHGAGMPVGAAAWLIAAHTPQGGSVMEPFGGTGTTLIASATLGRRCFMSELSPRYCDVIRRRWTRWAREHGRDPGPGALDG